MVHTAQTLTPDALPEGTRPEEFLRDEDLASFYERQLAATDPESDEAVELRRLARSARRGARMTALAIAEAQDDAAAELAASQEVAE